jgi:hypothetical protein
MRFEPEILFKKISFNVVTLIWIILLKCYDCDFILGSTLLKMTLNIMYALPYFYIHAQL